MNSVKALVSSKVTPTARDAKEAAVEKSIIIFDDVNKMRTLSNPVAWRILQLLSKQPMYPAQIAKELKIYEQSAYYYIRKLIAIGALEPAEKTLVRGGTAQNYKPTGPSFGIEMKWGEKDLDPSHLLSSSDNSIRNKYPNALRFFREYYDGNSFNGQIVVGSPDPHGPFKSSARDGHYSVHLAFFLGAITNSVPSEFAVRLDVDAKAEKLLAGSNLISIGGPGTNIVSAELNKYLPIRFDEENFWSGLVDAKTGKRYTSDNHGLIAKIRNPYTGKGNMIVVAGVRAIGTKSAVIALTNYSEKMLANYYGNEQNWALIVQGFDMDSDGKIDHVDAAASTGS